MTRVNAGAITPEHVAAVSKLVQKKLDGAERAADVEVLKQVPLLTIMSFDITPEWQPASSFR